MGVLDLLRLERLRAPGILGILSLRRSWCFDGEVRRLLFIGAHPDDETFFAAGTMAKYTEAGAQVSVLCATRGERGKTGDLCCVEDLPQVREQELFDAMGVLGVTDVQFLHYQDKCLADAPAEEIRRLLVETIRRTRPQLLITFDTHGANQHTDHIAISRFALDAAAAAADARWYPETGSAHQIERLLWTPPTILFKLPEGADIPALPGSDFVIDTTPWTEQKTAAFQAHRTQFPGLKKLFFDNPNGRRTFGLEVFRLAWGKRPATIPADDLFAE
jgi:LmbE family N-acetylglucosaminyl deacetylase